MTTLIMFAALISVLLDSWGRYLPLVVVVIVLWRVLRHFMVGPHKMLAGHERGSANPGRPEVVYDLSDADVGSAPKRITQYRVLGNDLVPLGGNGGIVAEQHFSDTERNIVIDPLSRSTAPENEGAGYDVRWIESALEAFEEADRASARTGRPHFVELASGSGVAERKSGLINNPLNTHKGFKLFGSFRSKRNANTLNGAGGADKQRIEHIRPVPGLLDLRGQLTRKRT